MIEVDWGFIFICHINLKTISLRKYWRLSKTKKTIILPISGSILTKLLIPDVIVLVFNYTFEQLYSFEQLSTFIGCKSKK